MTIFADTITSDALDQLYARVERLWDDLRTLHHAAEAATARVRAVADQLHLDASLAVAYRDAARRILAALDEPQEPRS